MVKCIICRTETVNSIICETCLKQQEKESKYTIITTKDNRPSEVFFDENKQIRFINWKRKLEGNTIFGDDDAVEKAVCYCCGKEIIIYDEGEKFHTKKQIQDRCKYFYDNIECKSDGVCKGKDIKTSNHNKGGE